MRSISPRRALHGSATLGYNRQRVREWSIALVACLVGCADFVEGEGSNAGTTTSAATEGSSATASATAPTGTPTGSSASASDPSTSSMTTMEEDTDGSTTSEPEDSTGEEVPPDRGMPVEPEFFEGLAFGPVNERCHTEGTSYEPDDDWRDGLASANEGDVILLEEGTFTASSEIVVPRGVSLFADDCADASIVVTRNASDVGSGAAIRVSDDSVVAGLTIEGTNTEHIIQFSGQQDSVVIRNNNLFGGQYDAIAFTDPGVSQILFEGNHINSGPAQLGDTPSVAGGSIVRFEANAHPEGVRFFRNKLEGNYFDDVLPGDDAVLILSGEDVVFEENWFTNQMNIGSFWDVRTRTPASDGGATTAIRNWFQEGCQGSHGSDGGSDPGTGTAVQYNDATTVKDLPTHVFEDNRVEIGTGRCTVFFKLGQTGDVKLRMLGNVFISDNSDPPDGGQSFNMRDVVVAHNTFYRGGAIKISDNTGFLADNGEGLKFSSNLFFRSFVNDRSDNVVGNVQVVTHNLLFEMASTFDGGVQTDNITDDPLFVDEGLFDLRLSPGSPAIGAAEDGTNIGAY